MKCLSYLFLSLLKYILLLIIFYILRDKLIADALEVRTEAINSHSISYTTYRKSEFVDMRKKEIENAFGFLRS